MPALLRDRAQRADGEFRPGAPAHLLAMRSSSGATSSRGSALSRQPWENWRSCLPARRGEALVAARCGRSRGAVELDERRCRGRPRRRAAAHSRPRPGRGRAGCCRRRASRGPHRSSRGAPAPQAAPGTCRPRRGRRACRGCRRSPSRSRRGRRRRPCGCDRCGRPRP